MSCIRVVFILFVYINGYVARTNFEDIRLQMSRSFALKVFKLKLYFLHYFVRVCVCVWVRFLKIVFI